MFGGNIEIKIDTLWTSLFPKIALSYFWDTWNLGV